MTDRPTLPSVSEGKRADDDANDANARFGVAHFAMLAAALATPVVVGLVILAFIAGLSPFGVMLALAVLGVWLGLFTLRRRMRARRRRGVTRASLAFFFVTLVLHAFSSQNNARAKLTTFPEHSSLRAFVGAAVPERDPAALAAAFLERMQALPKVERVNMTTTLSSGYSRMLEDLGFTPTPATLTWLGMQSANAFDVIEMPLDDQREHRAPEPLAIFLHGSAGNFTLECWAFASAAKKAGYSTWCPSMTIDGNWASALGGEILDVTLREAKRRGHGRIVIAGLSAGARGLSFLVPKLEKRNDVVAFMLLSGASAHARASKIKPSLVLHGVHDALTPISSARAYVSGDDHVSLVELVEYDANHFVMLGQQERVARDIERFLRALDPK